MSDIRSSFKDFIVKNGVVSTAASITIGFATATFVKSFVADVIMPVIFLIIVSGVSHVNKGTSKFFSQFLANKEFHFTNFVSELVTWIMIILAAFLILDLVVRKTLAKSFVSTESIEE
jgi:large-conductance mechanosensitive channel